MMEWTDQNVKRFWDYESKFKDNYFTFQVGDKVVSHFSKFLKSGSTVLDYGCGAGFLIEHLIAKNLNVYGLDFSSSSIEQVNKKFEGTHNFKGAYLPEGIVHAGLRFDSIIATEVIEHLYDDKLSPMMVFIKNSLTKNGSAIFTTPNDEDLSKSYVYCAEADVVFHRWQHVRSWNEDSLSRYLSNFFPKVSVYTTNFRHVPTKSEILKMNVKSKIKNFLGRNNTVKLPHLIAVVSGD